MKPRIEGATLPGYTATVVDDTGTAITNGTGYTWTCDATLSAGAHVHIWTKSTGITSTASGFTVVWAAGDMGALTAATAPTSYLLEFTGTSSGGKIIHQDTVIIKPTIT